MTIAKGDTVIYVDQSGLEHEGTVRAVVYPEDLDEPVLRVEIEPGGIIVWEPVSSIQQVEG